MHLNDDDLKEQECKPANVLQSGILGSGFKIQCAVELSYHHILLVCSTSEVRNYSNQNIFEQHWCSDCDKKQSFMTDLWYFHIIDIY